MKKKKLSKRLYLKIETLKKYPNNLIVFINTFLNYRVIRACVAGKYYIFSWGPSGIVRLYVRYPNTSKRVIGIYLHY